jgi:hypothetical protein
MSTPTAAHPVPAPKRSRRRWVLLGAFALLVLAMPFLYVMIAGWQRDRELEAIYREIEAEDPHWRWADLVKQLPPAPPDERNAVVQMHKVIRIMRPTPFSRGLFGGVMPKRTNARLKDGDEQRLRAALAALAPTTLEEARKLKDMPDGGITIDPAIHPKDVNFDAVKLLEVMRVLRHDVILLAHDDKMDDAADSCLALVHSAHAIGHFPSLFAQLIRVAGQIEAVGAIERTLGHGIVEEKRLATLQHALTIEAKHNSGYHAAIGERAFGHEYYLTLRDDRSAAAQHIREMRLDRTLQGKLSFFFPGMLLRSYPDHLRLQNETVRATKLIDEAQFEAWRKIEEAKQDSIVVPWDLTRTFILPQLKGLQMDQTRVRCAAAALAAERYRLKYDQWPTGIAELVKEGLLQAPMIDPYDGQPLRFHRTDTGMIVYSVGPDKVDSQGKKGNIGFELWHPNFRAVAAPAEVEAPMKAK